MNSSLNFINVLCMHSIPGSTAARNCFSTFSRKDHLEPKFQIFHYLRIQDLKHTTILTYTSTLLSVIYFMISRNKCQGTLEIREKSHKCWMRCGTKIEKSKCTDHNFIQKILNPKFPLRICLRVEVLICFVSCVLKVILHLNWKKKNSKHNTK